MDIDKYIEELENLDVSAVTENDEELRRSIKSILNNTAFKLAMRKLWAVAQERLSAMNIDPFSENVGVHVMEARTITIGVLNILSSLITLAGEKENDTSN